MYIIIFFEGNGIVEEDNETERTATRAIAAAVIDQKQHDDVYLHNAAQIAAGIANRDLHAIAGSIPEVCIPDALITEALCCQERSCSHQDCILLLLWPHDRCFCASGWA